MRILIFAIALAACGHHAPKCGAPTTATAPAGVQVLHFPAGDGVTVTADLYAPHPPTAPMIVLFHQAGYSRGEYRTIAPRLNELGFNAMAVDARSGEATQGVGNETAASACALGKSTSYLDAIADLRAAVTEARTHAQGKLLVWGSSYSSALVLVLGADLKADGVLSFSPGEYFDDQGKQKTWVADSARALTVPVFITSAKSEANEWAPIAAAIHGVTTFVPETDGHHGSSTLWPSQPDHDAYWTAVTAFLAPFH
ncbi:MAG TPA: dienelactone hydrolase family protein [Kofleriaceae bacterium]